MHDPALNPFTAIWERGVMDHYAVLDDALAGIFIVVLAAFSLWLQIGHCYGKRSWQFALCGPQHVEMAMLKFTIEALDAVFDDGFSLSGGEPSDEEEVALCLSQWPGCSEIEELTQDLVDED